MAVIASVISQHADEASFLWQLVRAARIAPHFDLADLTRLDLRLEAHLDGLRVAGDQGWQVCYARLADGEAGEVFAAAVLALGSGDELKIQPSLRVAAPHANLARGFISALGWLAYPRAEHYIQALCGSQSAAERCIGISAAAVQRSDPGAVLNNALSDTNLHLRARVLRAIGELGRVDLVPLIQEELTSEDRTCRFWAAWSTALLGGSSNSLQVLRSFAESAGPYRERAIQLAFRKMEINSAHSCHERSAIQPEHGYASISGAAVIGDPVRIPWLIDEMNSPRLARVAGEAFTMITGADIAYEDLERNRPTACEPGPTENPADENVEMDPDENLPWPDPDLIAGWWRQHGAEFQSGTRYLLGKPISIEWCQEVLRKGRQRQRAAAALELAIRQPGQPLFNVAAPGFRQQQILGIKT